jgi:hypothetical protein
MRQSLALGMGLLAVAALVAHTTACSSDSGDDDDGFDGAANAPGSTGGSQGATGGTGPGIGGNTATDSNEFTGAGTLADELGFEACASDAREAESMPADILIMLDKSISMSENRVPEPDGPTRWEVITQGLVQFVSAAESQGLGVGIHFFPQNPPPGDLTQLVSCLVEDYRTPTVEIGLLPGNAPAIVSAITSQQLGNLTPSYPALQGALEHAAEWQAANPMRPVAVVYATDGFPTDCDNMSIPSLAALAQQYANPTDGSRRIRTFVVGVGVGADAALAPGLDDIAQAGGTHQAHLVVNQGAIAELTDRLRRMAFSPIMCELDMPQPLGGEIIDPAEINVRFTPRNGEAEIIHNVAGEAQCATSGGGWYYDDPTSPTTIHICDETCEFFGGGVVEILMGCRTFSLG